MAYTNKPDKSLPELTSQRRLRESVEGGPGSGPRKGSGRNPHLEDVKKRAETMKSTPQKMKEHLSALSDSLANGSYEADSASEVKSLFLKDATDRAKKIGLLPGDASRKKFFNRVNQIWKDYRSEESSEGTV